MDMGALVLLKSLSDPASCEALAHGEWERLVRVGRMCTLLGVLHARLDAAGFLDVIPREPLRHLVAERATADFRQQVGRYEVRCLEDALVPTGVPVVLLKGAAYVAQGKAWAPGRPSGDVDIMVPAARLREVETALRKGGWHSLELDEYDERYYRDWSHEVPPMRHPDRRAELDLHHTIAPVTGRLRPNADELFDAAVQIGGSPFLALSPPDQFLHTAIHLIQDSDFWRQLRDLVDLDGMIRAQGAEPAFWEGLEEHASRHGLRRLLFYALRYSARFLDSPIPPEVMRRVARWGPPAPVASIMDGLVARSMLPGDPDVLPSFGARQSRRALKSRYMWLRFPPTLFVRHISYKTWRRVWEGR